MKKFLYGLISLVFITVVALLVGPGLWDWNGYKPEILKRFKAETGRQIAIDGDLSFAVLPSPRFAVDGVRIANVEGATEAEFARFKSLSVRIRLLPLLSGRVEVESVELINPVLQFESLADRRVNWMFGRPTIFDRENLSKGAVDRSEPTGEPSSKGRLFALDRLVIRGGQLVYRDAAKGTVKKLKNLDFEGFAESLTGPFGMKGALTFRGLRLDVSLLMGQLDGDGPVPLNLSLANAGTDAKAYISGGIESTKSQFRGKVKFSGGDIGKFGRAMGAGNVELPAWLGRNVDLVSRIEASPAGVSIYDIDLRIGDTSVRGGINAVFGERIRIEVALKAKRIDLDKRLSQALLRVDTGPNGNNGGATVQVSQSTADATSETSDGFVLPNDIDGTLDISIEAVAFKGRQMREISLAVALDEGTIKLNRLSARLPGGGSVSLTGSLITNGSQVSYRGDTSIRADNLRSVLDWLDADVSHVPADRLHRFQLKAKLDGDQEIVQITDLEMRLDSSRIRGGVTYALRRRPAFGARITIDQFNLDAYLPRPRLVGGRTAKTDQLVKGTSLDATASRDGATSSSSLLSVLSAFDANIILRVGTLNYRRTPIQGLFIDSGLVRGILTVRQASVRNISGTTGRISGTLGRFTGFPVFNGSFSVSSNNLTGLFRIVDIESPVAPRKLGQLKLTGKVNGANDNKIKLQTTLELAGAKFELAGQLADLGTTPLLDLDLRARHPDSVKLVRLFGTEIGATERGLGKIDLAAKATGRLDGFELTTRLSAIDAELTFTGKVTQLLAQPGLTGTIEARHPDFVSLVRTFDPNYRPAKPVTGPIRLLSQISASDTTARLDQFEFEVGATSFNGAADISLTGPKPTVTAKITADNIDLNTIFSIGKNGSKPAPISPTVVAAPAIPNSGPSGVRRYSREPIDFSMLDYFDGDVELSARSITWRSFRVNSLRLTANLQDSVLAVSELTGKTFGGSFDFDVLLDGRRVPKLYGTVKITEANVGKELIADRKVGIINGVLDLDMKLATAGRSQHDMVSTLAGQGRFATRNGMVLGFDLQAVSERLNNLSQPLKFLSLFAGAMRRGTTKFIALDGTMRIDNGVIRTDDLRMVSKAGLGEARGTIDLARWHLNMQALFWLAGTSNFPPFHVYLTGPPDQPDQNFDIAALQKFLIARIDERGVGSLLNKVLPRLVPQRQSEPDVPLKRTPKTKAPSREVPPSVPEQTLPLEIKPHDFIRSLLKGIER